MIRFELPGVNFQPQVIREPLMPNNANNGHVTWPEAISALYTWQIILAVFTEAGGLDARSLANETLGRLTNRNQCLPILMKFHCSIGSIPLENGTIRADALCLSQEVVEIIRDWKRLKWPKADKVVLREALMHLRRAIHETARRHEVSVKTWYLSDEEKCWELYVFIRDLSISEERYGELSAGLAAIRLGNVPH
ncbi:hypothetical protein BB8028_0010g00288 [Beauveria bassiana]|uniref:Uncharacterized protein n=1 Tax=Beauveria bassiana TaxID=176275 RepID=A0A2S7YPH2_BEABA|nr:hypothetical protein BB8028_0010g00288 [Beauveria bassiana]